MAARDDKRAAAHKRAIAIYDRLTQLPRPDDMSNAEWLKRAGVNASFFTNLKNGSEPSVGNLRDVLEVVGVSMPEFFLHEAEGRALPAPSEQALVQAFLDALPALPKRPDRRAEYLAAVVQGILRLPANLQPTQSGETGHHDLDEQGASPRRATK